IKIDGFQNDFDPRMQFAWEKSKENPGCASCSTCSGDLMEREAVDRFDLIRKDGEAVIQFFHHFGGRTFLWAKYSGSASGSDKRIVHVAGNRKATFLDPGIESRQVDHIQFRKRLPAMKKRRPVFIQQFCPKSL